MKPNEIFNTDNTGFVSFEELENAFKTPTQYQHFYEGAQRDTADDIPASLSSPDGGDPDDLDDAEEVSPEKAQRTGERIARLIDTGIDFTLSNFVARNGETYRADERDLQDIAEAWGEVSEEHQWNIGPEWTLAILYIMVYGPLVKQAVADRRMAELEARQAALEAQMKTIQMNQNATTDGPEHADTARHHSEPSPE